jgi:hypothetical protein
MPVRETSCEALIINRDHLEPNQDAVLAILEEIGPADDLRICEALNQKEAKTIKPKYLKHYWSINEVTPRRGELVGMRLVEDMGKFQHPDRRCAVHIWRVCGDKREPAGYWVKIIETREPVRLPTPVKRNEKTDYTMSPSRAGRILRECRRNRQNQDRQTQLLFS